MLVVCLGWFDRRPEIHHSSCKIVIILFFSFSCLECGFDHATIPTGSNPTSYGFRVGGSLLVRVLGSSAACSVPFGPRWARRLRHALAGPRICPGCCRANPWAKQRPARSTPTKTLESYDDPMTPRSGYRSPRDGETSLSFSRIRILCDQFDLGVYNIGCLISGAWTQHQSSTI